MFALQACPETWYQDLFWYQESIFLPYRRVYFFHGLEKGVRKADCLKLDHQWKLREFKSFLYLITGDQILSH